MSAMMQSGASHLIFIMSRVVEFGDLRNVILVQTINLNGLSKRASLGIMRTPFIKDPLKPLNTVVL